MDSYFRTLTLWKVVLLFIVESEAAKHNLNFGAISQLDSIAGSKLPSNRGLSGALLSAEKLLDEELDPVTFRKSPHGDVRDFRARPSKNFLNPANINSLCIPQSSERGLMDSDQNRYARFQPSPMIEPEPAVDLERNPTIQSRAFTFLREKSSPISKHSKAEYSTFPKKEGQSVPKVHIPSNESESNRTNSPHFPCSKQDP